MAQFLTLCSDDFQKIAHYLIHNNQFVTDFSKVLAPKQVVDLPPQITGTVIEDAWVEALCQPLHRSCIGGKPGVLDDVVETMLNEPVLIDVLFNDSPATRNCPIDPTTLVIVIEPVNGTAVIQNGEVLYTPNTGFVGNDSFEYRVFDECCNCDDGRVEIAVLPNHIPPTCTGDTVVLTENDTVQVTLANFVTVGSGAIATYVIDDGPLNGVASINPDNTLDYTPTLEFIGYDYVTIVVTDVNGLSCEFDIIFHVQPIVVTAPIAPDITVSVPFNTVNNTINIASAVTVDVNCGHVQTSITTAPANGTATVNGLNLRYSNSENWQGVETMVYRITDGCGQTASGTITINVVTPGVQVNSCAILNGLDCQYLVLNLATTFVCAGATIIYLASPDDCDNVRAVQATPALINGNTVFFRYNNNLPFNCNDNPVSIACL